VKNVKYNYEDPNAIRYSSQSLLPNLVQVPKEAPTQFANQMKDWTKGQVEDKAAMIGLVGAPLVLGGVIPTVRYGVTISPKAQATIAALGNLPIGRNIVNFGQAAANNPMLQKADRAVTKLIDWIF